MWSTTKPPTITRSATTLSTSLALCSFVLFLNLTLLPVGGGHPGGGGVGSAGEGAGEGLCRYEGIVQLFAADLTPHHHYREFATLTTPAFPFPLTLSFAPDTSSMDSDCPNDSADEEETVLPRATRLPLTLTHEARVAVVGRHLSEYDFEVVEFAILRVFGGGGGDRTEGPSLEFAPWAVMQADSDGSGSERSSASELKRAQQETTSTVDVRRAAVIIVNFLDEKVGCSAKSIQSMLWSEGAGREERTVQRFYEEASHGQFSFDRDEHQPAPVFGPFTLPYNLNDLTRCTADSWAAAAEQMVFDAGVSLAPFRHLVFILPSTQYLHSKLCRWNGLGNIGCGRFCRIWVSDCDKQGVFEHELGHNLGLRHAASNYALLGDKIEYGDPTAIMGNQWWKNWKQEYFLNAAHLYELGWLNPLGEVGQSGDAFLIPYNQLPYNLPADCWKALIVRRPDVHQPNGPYYLFSYVSGPNVFLADRVHVHLYEGKQKVTQYLMSLDVGESFTDVSSRFEVTFAHFYQDRIHLAFQFSCRPAPSSVRVLPSPNYVLVDEVEAKAEAGAVRTAPQRILFPTDLELTPEPITISFEFRNSNNQICPPVVYQWQFATAAMPLLRSASDASWSVSTSESTVPSTQVRSRGFPVTECDFPKITITGRHSCVVSCAFEPTLLSGDAASRARGARGESLYGQNVTVSLLGNSRYFSASNSATLSFVPSTVPLCLYRSLDLRLVAAEEVLSLSLDTVLTGRLSVSNRNTVACPASVFAASAVVSVCTPALSASVTLKASSADVTLEPGGSVLLDFEVLLQVRVGSVVPPACSDAIGNVTFVFVETRDFQEQSPYHASPQSTLTVPLHLTAPCVEASPVVVLEERSIVLSHAQGGRVLLHLSNNSSRTCPPTSFSVSLATNATSSTLLSYSLLPGPSIEVPAQTTRTVAIVVHSPMNSTRPQFIQPPLVEVGWAYSTPIVAAQANTFGAAVQLPLTVSYKGTPCSRHQVVMQSGCSAQIDLSGAKFSKKYKCAMHVFNQDSTLCPSSLFAYRAELVSALTADDTAFEIKVDPEQSRIEPGNYTKVVLAFTLPDSYTNSTPAFRASFAFDFGVTGSSGLGLHNATRSDALSLGHCQRANITLALRSAPSLVSPAGGQVAFRLRSVTESSPFCYSKKDVKAVHVLKVGQDAPAFDSKPWKFTFGKVNSTAFETNWRVTATAPTEFPAQSNLTFSIPLVASDQSPAALKTKAVTMVVVQVDDLCVIKRPLINLYPERIILSSGAPSIVQASINVTNSDSVLCPPSTLRLSVGKGTIPAIPDSLVAAYNRSQYGLVLAPAESHQLAFNVSSLELLPPGNFSLSVRATDPRQPSHSALMSLQVEVECPVPRPAFNFNIQPLSAALASTAGNLLYWNACIVAAECCCPCTYEIQRDGVIVGMSNRLNYTDQTSLSQIGLEFNYSVVVIDRLSRRSTPYTCGTSGFTTVSTSDYDFLLVIIVLSCLFLLPLFVCVVEKIRVAKRCDGPQHLEEWEHDDRGESSGEAIDLRSYNLLPTRNEADSTASASSSSSSTSASSAYDHAVVDLASSISGPTRAPHFTEFEESGSE